MHHLGTGHVMRPHQPEQNQSTQAVPSKWEETLLQGALEGMPQMVTRNSRSKLRMQVPIFSP